MNIGPTGIWQCDTTEPHTFDKGLFSELLMFCDVNCVDSVADMGCGSGMYVAGFNQRNIVAVGFDGNPNTWKFCADCHQQDLSVEFRKGKFDLVLSLEVGEHIPSQFESVFIDNLVGHAGRFIILSWFPIPGHGIGHVNERSNQYVRDAMELRGFKSDDGWQQVMRESADSWWFKESLMVFQRI